MMRKYSIIYIISILIFISCKESHTRKIDKERNVTGLEKDDPTFLRLKDTAQKYLPDFISSLNKNKADTNYYFVIKSDFEEYGTHEHMWSSPIAIKDNVFTCIFIDSAYNVNHVKKGDTIFVKNTDVEDWAIYDYYNKKKTGSFSEKYLSGEE